MFINPVKALRRQGSACRTHRAQSAEVVFFLRTQPLFHAGDDEGCTGAEVIDFCPFGKCPQGVEIGVSRTALVQNDGGARQQGGLHEVPHHPAGSGIPEKALALVYVVVESEVFEMLHQHTAMRVGDGLGQARSAGRVEHPNGMRKGQRLEAQGRGVSPIKVVPKDDIRNFADIGLSIQEGNENDFLHRGHGLFEALHFLALVIGLAVVGVAVHREKDAGFYLAKAV